MQRSLPVDGQLLALAQGGVRLVDEHHVLDHGEKTYPLQSHLASLCRMVPPLHTFSDLRGKELRGTRALGAAGPRGAAGGGGRGAGVGAASVAEPPGAIKNVELMANLPEAANATAINFLTYGKKDRGHGRLDWIWDWFGQDKDGDKDKSKDVMLVTGRFGLKTYDLSDPANPKLLDEITAEELRLPGDPPYSPSNPTSTFWQNEDMDVDKKRKLALLSRDPRAYRGSTTREPGEADPNGATNIAGVYVVDAKNPADLKLLSFTQLPTGHTTVVRQRLRVAVDRRAGRDHDAAGRARLDVRAADRSSPTCATRASRGATRCSRSTSSARTASPPIRTTSTSTTRASPGSPASAARAATGPKGLHYDPVKGKIRVATPLDPVPYAGGGLDDATVGPNAGGWMHNSWRPIGADRAADRPALRQGRAAARHRGGLRSRRGCRARTAASSRSPR